MPLIRAELRRRKIVLPSVLIHDLSQVLYLPFSKDDGDYARDRSGHVNHGTIYGATRVAGSALSFDGENDYVQIPHDPSLTFTSENFTILTRIYPTVILPEYHYVLFHKGFSDLEGYALMLEAGDSNIWLVTWQEIIAQNTKSNPKIVVDEWFHIAAVRNGTKGYIYINGKDETMEQPIIVDPLPSTEPAYIGMAPGFGHYYEGVMDDVRVYNRALSAAEIARLMNMKA